MPSDTQNVFTFIWTIENYSYCTQKLGESLVSPVFEVDTLENTRWVLLLYPQGQTCRNVTSLYLRRQDDQGPAISLSIDYEFSFLSAEGTAIHSQEIKDMAFTRTSTWGCPNFIKSSTLLDGEEFDFLPRDTLTVRCQMSKSGMHLLRSEICFARTRIGVEVRSFFWRIEKFSSLKKYEKRTVKLQASSKKSPEFFMSLYLVDGFDGIEVRISISSNGSPSPFVSILELSLIDSSGQVSSTKEREHLFYSKESEELLFPESVTWSKLMDNKDLYLPSDILSLKCLHSISFGVVSSEVEDSRFADSATIPFVIQYSDRLGYDIEGECPPLKHNLSNDMKTLLKGGIFSDKKLRAQVKEFVVHKCILSARSPVFRAMFSADMKEKTSACDVLSDLDDDTLQRMLLYLYTDRIDNICFESATKLYFAADKYEIVLLKDYCSAYLKSSISYKNVCEVLILADRHQDADLKAAAQEFCANHEGIFCSSEWSSLMKTNQCLALVTMHYKYAHLMHLNTSQGKGITSNRLRSSLKLPKRSIQRRKFRTFFRSLRIPGRKTKFV